MVWDLSPGMIYISYREWESLAGSFHGQDISGISHRSSLYEGLSLIGNRWDNREDPYRIREVGL